MVQALNTKLFFVFFSNAMMSPVNIKQGRIFYGDQGIEFRANAGGGYKVKPLSLLVAKLSKR